MDSVPSSNQNLKAWLICLTASLFPFYAFIQMSSLNTMSVELLQDAHIGSNQLGILSASYIYADAFFLLPAGILFDRLPTQKLMLWGITLSVIGVALFASSLQFSVIECARIVSGIGHAFAFLGCFRLVSQWFPAQRQAFVIGLILTIALFGGAVAQIPLRLLIQEIGWRSALWCNVGIGTSIGATLWFILPKEKINIIKTKITDKLWFNLQLACKNSQNWLAGSYTCLLGVPLMLLGTAWGSIYLTTTKQASVLSASWITTSIFLGTMVGTPLMGWISDKLVNRKLPMVLGASISLILMLIILYDPDLTIFWQISLFFALSVCTGAQTIGYTVIMESNPATNSSTAMGLANVFIMGGLATAQIVFGVLWNNILLHRYATIVFLSALTASILFALFTREMSGSKSRSSLFVPYPDTTTQERTVV